MRRHTARDQARAKNGNPERRQSRPAGLRKSRPSAELGAVLLDTLGLPATIEWHLHRFRRRTGIPWDLQVHDAAGFDLPEGYAMTICDLHSEVLDSIARHSGASRVAVALTITSSDVTMVMRDNGFGGQGTATERSGIIVTLSLPISAAMH